MKILKIAFGSAVAIILADLIGLNYSTAAGIITLLTIQDTTKETIFISLKRLLAFCFATLFSFAIFNLIGYHAVSFGIFLLAFVWICYALRLQDAIAMNAVLATHYLLEGSIPLSLITNEFMLLLIGAGVGTVLNLFMPDKVKHIRNTQAILETDLKKVLSKMSRYLLLEFKEGYTDDCFTALEEHIQTGLKYAYDNTNNSFSQDSQYFIDYMQMRKQQCQVLRNIYEKIISLNHIPPQAKDISDFIDHIEKSLKESNNAGGLLLECHALFQKFQESDLPATRQEFEARAVLYMILKDFEYFLQIKGEFAASLSEEQKKKYWTTV
ncbi:aromatic acid exporter family protein [Konateibacter massiliensis]|uniref:aromatic acid exporter family protein n=1 Tax=Konateibacter massiliensis TaxID=2002841 RepID=UPI0015D4EF51|nr:aromatic acid exporter family protein [Konateibacter massiliensis]